jgi:type VI secretion system protein ImpF
MRAPDKSDRLQIPLMYAFRDAALQRDSTKKEDIRIDGERVVSDRASLRRRGVDERRMRQDLEIDLAALVDTVNLASVTDLSGLDYVKRSILNFGLDDLTHITIDSRDIDDIGKQLKAAILDHEPRLTPDSVAVERSTDDEVNQRVRFRVKAEMSSKPLDIPIEFVAEVDVGSGKILIPRLSGST